MTIESPKHAFYAFLHAAETVFVDAMPAQHSSQHYNNST